MKFFCVSFPKVESQESSSKKYFLCLRWYLYWSIWWFNIATKLICFGSLYIATNTFYRLIYAFHIIHGVCLFIMPQEANVIKPRIFSKCMIIFTIHHIECIVFWVCISVKCCKCITRFLPPDPWQYFLLNLLTLFGWSTFTIIAETFPILLLQIIGAQKILMMLLYVKEDVMTFITHT